MVKSACVGVPGGLAGALSPTNLGVCDALTNEISIVMGDLLFVGSAPK
jgi:hypothetical protein